MKNRIIYVLMAVAISVVVFLNMDIFVSNGNSISDLNMFIKSALADDEGGGENCYSYDFLTEQYINTVYKHYQQTEHFDTVLLIC